MSDELKPCRRAPSPERQRLIGLLKDIKRRTDVTERERLRRAGYILLENAEAIVSALEEK